MISGNGNLVAQGAFGAFGLSDQDASLGADAAAVSDASSANAASNGTDIVQTATSDDDKGGTNIDQDADAEVAAAVDAESGQVNSATNTNGVAQVAGTGLASQNADIGSTAFGDADQDLTGSSVNDTLIAQDADGAGNIDQFAWFGASADTDLDADQDNLAGNSNSVFQDCGSEQVFGGDGDGDGACDQSAWLGVTADADAGQNVDGVAANDTIILQEADGPDTDHKSGGNFGQSADAEVAAGTTVDATQVKCCYER